MTAQTLSNILEFVLNVGHIKPLDYYTDYLLKDKKFPTYTH